MRKVISLFQRNYDGDRLVRDEIVPGAEWVAIGEGVATEKYDGTACLITNGTLYKRFDAKEGRTPPASFFPSQEPDPVTGHWPGWVLVGNGPEDRWVREAFEQARPPDGWVDNWTYELLGPKVQSNRYRLDRHTLYRHGTHQLDDVPRTFDALRAYLTSHPEYEGIVWWRTPEDVNSDLVKIKRRDFGLSWEGVRP